eukprot:840036_1
MRSISRDSFGSRVSSDYTTLIDLTQHAPHALFIPYLRVQVAEEYGARAMGMGRTYLLLSTNSTTRHRQRKSTMLQSDRSSMSQILGQSLDKLCDVVASSSLDADVLRSVHGDG